MKRGESAMLAGLSLRNAKRQAKDYLVYFITMILAVALFYAFNALVFSPEVQQLNRMMDSMTLIIVATSIVIVFILGWLVRYTMRFMLGKRSRELGTYLLLGVENRSVAGLFFRENLLVGGVALAFGLLLGNLIFQLLKAIVMWLFGTSYRFGFGFSLRAILLTLLYYALIYLFALLRSRKSIARMKIHDLLYLERQNEGELVTRQKSRRRLFAVSCVCGVLAFVLIALRTAATGFAGAVLLIVFFYGFYTSFSSAVPTWYDKRPRRKYRGNTLFVLRSLTSKLASMGITMATLALLFTITLVSIGFGVFFSNQFSRWEELNTSFDLYIGAEGESDFSRYRPYVEENLDIADSLRYDVYLSDTDQVTQLLRGHYDRMDWEEYAQRDCLMRFSDYVALRQMLGYEPVTLPEGGYILHCLPFLQRWLENVGDIRAGGQTLRPAQIRNESFTQYQWQGNGTGFILVVPDELAEGYPVEHSAFAAMVNPPFTIEQFRAVRDLSYSHDDGNDEWDQVSSLPLIKEENVALYTMIVFPLFYLALIMIMVSATILTIQLLSELTAYRHRYRLLGTLGVDEKGITNTIRKQFFVYFSLPAAPPVVISSLILVILGLAFDSGIVTGWPHLLGMIGIVLAVFLFLYFVYILAAYNSFKRNVTG